MKKLFLFLAMIIVAIGLSLPASAHTLYDGQHSVSNGFIYWGTYRGSTQYTAARNAAISSWNSAGSIITTGDTPNVTETLSFSDYRANDGYNGSWQQKSGADLILFNENYFEDMDPCERTHTALHEIGHALNLDHNFVSGSVLQSGTLCMNAIGSHDKADIIDRWGYFSLE